ncbi:unnamed protein product [Callosobruchus maculatus]|uniref:Cytohesin Ubiquitin Protein Inducing domain-containing protein n=1 Tax=Callosobruchus maculatus TaxID=64391 RepID=A0A653DVJ6_CALMS|nr:unnamed protein product [Callosobruchus maculatus]
MEDEANSEEKLSKMGATSNNNAARIAVLQERKKQIEETLAKRTQELKQLCIQEAELTGITPPEMPLEPGETLPCIRRRVGTAYQLSENLIRNSNSKDELIADLELQIQLHANMAEAALGLANEQNLSKTMKRQHRSEYQKHKNQCMALQGKLALLKEKANSEHKQKKKPRAPEFVSEDSVSLGTTVNEPFTKTEVRHSIRSAKHSPSSQSGNSSDQRYEASTRSLYQQSDMSYIATHYRPEDLLASGVYRLSLNGYNKYMEKRENINVYPSSYSVQPPNMYQYNTTQNTQQNCSHMPQHSPYMSQHSPHLSQHNVHMSQHSPHSSQHSPHLSHVSQHSPLIQQHSPQLSQHNLQLQRNSHVYSYPQYSEYRLSHNPSLSNSQLHRQSSPPKSQYYPSQTVSSYRGYEGSYRNPHQIQPHQQYEQMNVTSGLGGCWKRAENGEFVWCNSSTIDINWHRDKRFGSLDRRKNKRITKRMSPNVDNKSATLATVPNYQEQIRSASVKSSQNVIRRNQDNGNLVRTQSLGSVGAQTVDSILYPSDDNSSCGSDNRINQNLRKHKEKEWFETSLDGSVSPTQSVRSSSQPMIPTILAPEEKYVSSPPQQCRPITPKPPLEIPAESNPSPRVQETNIEFFNNNIPKNCTIVQAGHCKPYHEETKPFEMSDFYKYSTKFKKSPSKTEVDGPSRINQNVGPGASSRSLTERFDDSSTQYSPKQQYNNR